MGGGLSITSVEVVVGAVNFCSYYEILVYKIILGIVKGLVSV